MKKLVAIILAVMTFTSILPATASAIIAEADYPYRGVNYTGSSSTKKSTTKTKTKTKSSSTTKKTTTTKTTTTAKKTK